MQKKKKLSNKDLVYGINFTLNHQINYMKSLMEVHQKDIEKLEQQDKENPLIIYQIKHHESYIDGLKVGLEVLVKLKESLIKNAGKQIETMDNY
jgi:hypothetical protein